MSLKTPQLVDHLLENAGRRGVTRSKTAAIEKRGRENLGRCRNRGRVRRRRRSETENSVRCDGNSVVVGAGRSKEQKPDRDSPVLTLPRFHSPGPQQIGDCDNHRARWNEAAGPRPPSNLRNASCVKARCNAVGGRKCEESQSTSPADRGEREEEENERRRGGGKMKGGGRQLWEATITAAQTTVTLAFSRVAVATWTAFLQPVPKTEEQKRSRGGLVD